MDKQLYFMIIDGCNYLPMPNEITQYYLLLMQYSNLLHTLQKNKLTLNSF